MLNLYNCGHGLVWQYKTFPCNAILGLGGGGAIGKRRKIQDNRRKIQR
jgi:hypothetical protein